MCVCVCVNILINMNKYENRMNFSKTVIPYDNSFEFGKY